MNEVTLRSTVRSIVALLLVALTHGDVAGQQFSFWPEGQTGSFDPWNRQANETTEVESIVRGQDSGGEGGGDLAGDATNPTSSLTQYQIQNTFIPSTYEASGFAHTLSLQLVKPFETGHCFFPAWITRTTLPVVTTADPDGSVPIGPPNDSEFSVPLDNQSGLSDLVFISILNHPTDWGSWGIGPGFVAPGPRNLWVSCSRSESCHSP